MKLTNNRVVTAAASATLAAACLFGAHAAATAPQPTHSTAETQTMSEMQAAFSTLDDAAAHLEPGDFTQVGTYHEWPAYVVRTDDGAVTVALGNPMVMDRVACPFGATGLMETLGADGLDALRTVAPEGAPYIMIGGHKIPFDIVDLYTSTGDIRAVENEMRARNIC